METLARRTGDIEAVVAAKKRGMSLLLPGKSEAEFPA
jgi:hypothetical protein